MSLSPGSNKRQTESRTQDVVSDSGAESCNEETRRRTAEAFMTGIMSSIPGTEAARPVMMGQEGVSPQEDIVSEVRQRTHECGRIMFVNSGRECSDKANGFSTKRFVALRLICKYKS